jgi:hypothetical protein
MKPGACAARAKMSRNSSMAQIRQGKGGTSLRNMAQSIKQRRKNDPTSYRRKSYAMLKVPTVMHLQNAKAQRLSNVSTHSSKRKTSKYGSILNESSTHREHVGEYSYGKGGASFMKQAKVSKFDEEKERIYSPGPARYVPRAHENSAVFSFGKQKKDFSFVQSWSKDVPSPGKYKVKRDFLSKKTKAAK